MQTADEFFEKYSLRLKTAKTDLEDYRRKGLAEENEDFDTHPTLGIRINEMPYVVQNEGVEDAAAVLLEDILSEVGRLSRLYSDRVRWRNQIEQRIKKTYEERQKIIANMRYAVQINGANKLGKNKQFVADIATFVGSDPIQVGQLCETNYSLRINGLTEQKAKELVTLVNRYTYDVMIELDPAKKIMQ